MSPTPNPAVETPRPMRGIPLVPIDPSDKRGEAKVELRMDSICGAAHGLSLMIVFSRSIKGSALFELLTKGTIDSQQRRQETHPPL